MNVVDIIIIIVLLIYIAKGFSNGVLKELVTFVGGFAVIVIAFLLKNPVSVFLYENMPFFKLPGMFSGISVLNIIIYEVIAFLLVATVLMLAYQLIVRLTNLVEWILKITFILEIPSKILGAVVGFIEGIIFVFIVLFVCMQFESTRNFLDESKFSHAILTDTPILGSAISPIYNSWMEIREVAVNYKDKENREEANLECFEILLKYKVIDSANAQVLIDNNKLTIKGAQGVVDKYSGQAKQEG